MTVAALRRLPGFAFEAEVPVHEDVLPRMDVAIFVGFAASGPVNLPVPIEDPARFAAVFGTDAPLAWDEKLGRPAYAQLAPAVRMFFSNGGTRCWVVRVAGAASSSSFPVPGIAAVGHGQSVTIGPLLLHARSPGSWSDDVRLSASLTSQRVAVIDWSSNTPVLSAPRDMPLAAGDLLQISWRGAEIEGFVGVESTVTKGEDRRLRRTHQEITFGAAAWFDLPRGHSDGVVSVYFEVPPGEQAPQPGEVITTTVDGKKLVLWVSDVALDLDDADLGSPPRARRRVRVRGKGLRPRAAMPVFSPGERPTVRRLGIDLWARRDNRASWRIGSLGLAPSSARHIGLLPDDLAVYDPTATIDKALWQDAIAPRFPVAGDGRRQLCIPFGVGALPENYLAAHIPEGTALERDGLVPFNAALFGDEALAASLSRTLVADAEYERYLAPRPTDAPEPRLLAGLHAALPIEEATIISVPDAAQAGWRKMEAAPPSAPAPAEPVKAAEPCPKDDFEDCKALTDRSASDSTTIDGTRLDWSAGPRRSDAADRWRVAHPDEYRDDVLLGIHRMLLRLCAARRDAMAVLSLPEHYDEDAALAHARLLASPRAPFVPLGKRDIAPLGAGEADALGFAALYHGWLFARVDGELRTIAPDGFACGVIARRAIERGAWVAPANELLSGASALQRPALPARWADLQQSSINVLRADPRGLVVMSADTLSPDADVRPINVRRLLIVLRRLALRLGNRYVFEPNDDAFRRMVQRAFEAALGDLFQRGAFAGATAATAFQVVTAESLNTSRARDHGQFIVELRVAPSRPMAFLTLRLVRTGDAVTVSGG